MRSRDHVANGLATAMLAGPWHSTAMRARTRSALGRSRSPIWLTELVEQVLEAYRDPPLDRPRELAAYLPACPAWPKAWAHRRTPRIVEWTPVPTTVTTRPWPVELLPDHGALARLLDLDQGELAWFADLRGWQPGVAQPLRHYRWSALPKRDGVRLVAAPKPRLKEIQRRLLRHVFERVPLHEAAHGSVRGRSVGTALAPHTGADVVIRMDLAEFFTSVPAGRVWSLLRIAGIPEGVAHTITGLVTTIVPADVLQTLPADTRPINSSRLTAPHLPTGAPTSPAVANAVAFALDRRLSGLAARFDVRYTRYVDDLVFSGGPSLRSRRHTFTRLVEGIVRDEQFGVNEAKTVVLDAAGRQALLGAVVNRHATLARPERDALRALLHNCARHGWRTQARGRENFPEHVLGRISWAGGLDPALGGKLRHAYDAIDWT